MPPSSELGCILMIILYTIGLIATLALVVDIFVIVVEQISFYFIPQQINVLGSRYLFNVPHWKH